MAKKDNAERDDLIHLIKETVAGEGYDIDNEIETEIARLAKFIIMHNDYDTEEDELGDSNLYNNGDDLWDPYEDEDVEIIADDDEEIL